MPRRPPRFEDRLHSEVLSVACGESSCLSCSLRSDAETTLFRWTAERMPSRTRIWTRPPTQTPPRTRGKRHRRSARRVVATPTAPRARSVWCSRMESEDVACRALTPRIATGSESRRSARRSSSGSGCSVDRLGERASRPPRGRPVASTRTARDASIVASMPMGSGACVRERARWMRTVPSGSVGAATLRVWDACALSTSCPRPSAACVSSRWAARSAAIATGSVGRGAASRFPRVTESARCRLLASLARRSRLGSARHRHPPRGPPPRWRVTAHATRRAMTDRSSTRRSIKWIVRAAISAGRLPS
jgi:hypothetical protein